jgi:hypothetical protein
LQHNFVPFKTGEKPQKSSKLSKMGAQRKLVGKGTGGPC